MATEGGQPLQAVPKGAVLPKDNISRVHGCCQDILPHPAHITATWEGRTEQNKREERRGEEEQGRKTENEKKKVRTTLAQRIRHTV